MFADGPSPMDLHIPSPYLDNAQHLDPNLATCQPSLLAQYDTWVATIDPNKLHSPSSSLFDPTYVCQDTPLSSSSIDLDSITADELSSWIAEITGASEAETTSEEHSPAPVPGPTSEARSREVTPERPVGMDPTPMTPDTPLTPCPPSPCPSDHKPSPITPFLVTPTTPLPAISSPFFGTPVPIALRRARRNVSAPIRSHIDLKAIIDSSSDDDDEDAYKPMSPKSPKPARSRKRPAINLDYTSSDESLQEIRATKKPRLAGKSPKGKAASASPGRKPCRRDPEKRRSQNEEAQRGYRQRRAAKFEAYQDGFERLRELCNTQAVSDKRRVAEVKSIIEEVERVVEEHTRITGQRSATI